MLKVLISLKESIYSFNMALITFDLCWPHTCIPPFLSVIFICRLLFSSIVCVLIKPQKMYSPKTEFSLKWRLQKFVGRLLLGFECKNLTISRDWESQYAWLCGLYVHVQCLNALCGFPYKTSRLLSLLKNSLWFLLVAEA